MVAPGGRDVIDTARPRDGTALGIGDVRPASRDARAPAVGAEVDGTAVPDESGTEGACAGALAIGTGPRDVRSPELGWVDDGTAARNGRGEDTTRPCDATALAVGAWEPGSRGSRTTEVGAGATAALVAELVAAPAPRPARTATAMIEATTASAPSA
jgi:hypothetical protein